ncbi:DEAD/DEAH box helicase [Sediminispirochaeta smaragdinae]|uniref:DEAD/DEAH box helicase domain protein n=1 Tax=Sediminispirochaeta smaragdinae (strain DSM 11293 / JCM 15392 / SEBR 4228) TaxID=573413 RepID=E1R4I7_SEDSS|nr:DEAD/DEAH box helicase [Sediminispirochaeta smaragdinae]ADK81728.1 DEAD/DEAH box helicase domain protein [Sediminispirochaeta smaragdinae DSM 11293]
MTSPLEGILEELKRDRSFASNVGAWKRLPAREGSYAPFPKELDERIVTALGQQGIGQLYSHQRLAWEKIRAGEHCVVVTPTASGKTLAYNLPVMQRLLAEPEARALYLFPTKALSQDQQSALNDIVLSDDLPVKITTYDGDTPKSLRVSARESGRIVISNPDMLHSGILPNHPKWIKFLSNLRFVVIDEVHTYRGIFGSHMANLMRRLVRIAGFYGSKIQFICCSATIKNPGELAEKIIGEPVSVIEENGAPSGAKNLILYNPPLVDAVQGIRRGVVLESRDIALRFLRGGVKTIVFGRSRIRVELIADYINKALANHFNENHRTRVEAYRGGYLPGERRQIERGLRDGSIKGVVSTNALELGIDIGGLDAAVLAGIPASVSSALQQSGRAGRGASESVAVLVASASPTDQYLVGHEDYFFGRSPEAASINPENLYILLDHLKCALFELPFSEGEDFGGNDTEPLLSYLEEEGVARYTGGKWFWADRGYPAEGVSLRSASSENVVIINTTGGKNEVIGEMDLPSAKELLFPKAVYLHRGRQFQSLRLDVENRRCDVEESSLNYYTDSIVKSDIKPLEIDLEESFPWGCALLADVLVRNQVAKYKKLKFATHENIGYGDISLPEEEMHTRSFILRFDEGGVPAGQFSEVEAALAEEVIARSASLLLSVAPLFLLCDHSDIGVSERLRDPHFALPAIYFYDKAPGGIGLAESMMKAFPAILKAGAERVSSCSCESGCPSCCGPDLSPDGGRKEAVVRFLNGWVRASGLG